MDNYKITADETLRETVQHGDSSYPFTYYPENIWQFDFHRIDWHWHYELEFVYVAEGTATCLAGTDKIELKEGLASLLTAVFFIVLRRNAVHLSQTLFFHRPC